MGTLSEKPDQAASQRIVWSFYLAKAGPVTPDHLLNRPYAVLPRVSRCRLLRCNSKLLLTLPVNP